jgi:nitroreductase
MDAYEAMNRRKTVYSFSNKALSEEIVIKLLDVARMAPAAGGIHEYEFIVVSESAKKDEISKICLTPHINGAPFMIIVICDPEKLETIFGSDGESVFCVENASLAIENIILYAAELGIGSAWIATVQQDALKRLLDIPERYVVRGVIPIGYPNGEETSAPNIVLPKLKEITHIESFNNRIV